MCTIDFKSVMERLCEEGIEYVLVALDDDDDDEVNTGLNVSFSSLTKSSCPLSAIVGPNAAMSEWYICNHPWGTLPSGLQVLCAGAFEGTNASRTIQMYDAFLEIGGPYGDSFIVTRIRDTPDPTCTDTPTMVQPTVIDLFRLSNKQLMPGNPLTGRQHYQNLLTDATELLDTLKADDGTGNRTHAQAAVALKLVASQIANLSDSAC